MTHSSFCQFHSDSFKKPENRTIWLDATICFNSPSSSSVLLLSHLSEYPCKTQVSVFKLYKYHDKFSRVFTQGSLGMFSMAFHSTKKVKKLRLKETFRQLCSIKYESVVHGRVLQQTDISSLSYWYVPVYFVLKVLGILIGHLQYRHLRGTCLLRNSEVWTPLFPSRFARLASTSTT